LRDELRARLEKLELLLIRTRPECGVEGGNDAAAPACV
jgi:hypothetical protein